MPYEPTNWQTGETITAEKLNKLENGISELSNYDIVFTATEDSVTADGLSVEELYQKGGGNLNALMIVNGARFIKSFAHSLYIEDGVTNVSFEFLPGTGAIINHISTAGTASIFGSEATYTYSNGHYTFTATEEPTK